MTLSVLASGFASQIHKVSLTFKQKGNLFHQQAKHFKLIFFIRKTFLYMVKTSPYRQSICQVPNT